MKVRAVAVLAVSVVITSTALAAVSREVTVDDYFSIANLTESEISPAGDKVAYIEHRWQESSNDRKTDVWVVHTDGGPATRLTFDGTGDSHLTWSPDGRFLYFVGARKRPDEKAPPFDGENQVWRLSIDGGELVPVTRSAGGIGAFTLSADGASIFFTTNSAEYAGDWAKLRKQFGDIKYGEPKSPKTVVWKLNLVDWRTDKLLEYAGYVDDLAISPDGSRLALITAPNDEVVTLEGQTRLTVFDVAAGTTSDLPDDVWRRNAPSPFGRLYSPRWAADSKVLAFSVGFDAYPSEIIIADWHASPAPHIKLLPRPAGVSLFGSVDAGAQLLWRGKSHDLCFLGEQQARIRAYVAQDAIGPVNTSEALTPGDLVVEHFSLSASGDRLAAVTSGPAFMPDVYLFDKSQGKALTRVNPQIRNWRLPKVSIVQWRGANGDNVEGVLELPADHQPGKPLPVIVNLHGGPTTSWWYRLYYGYFGSVLYASQGYAFFSPNYRGSTGYGDRFLTQLVGHENEIEVEDILKGIDHLVTQGTIDSKKIGVAGWSNGGYLTNCLITRRQFAAASSGAGIADVVQQWATTDEPAMARVFGGGTLWQQPDVYRRFSPIWQFDRVTTPTVIHVCTGDRRCPPGNSRMVYRALRNTLCQPAELLVYPDNGHGPSQYQSRKAKLTWDLVWFDHYLRGKPIPKGCD